MFRIRCSQHFLFRNASGFFTDVFKALSCYGIDEYFIQYATCAEFPSRIHWKKIVLNHIWTRVISDWFSRICQAEFNRFRSIHCSYDLCDVWYFANKRPKCLTYCFAVVKFISYTTLMIDQCKYCNNLLLVTSLVDHTIIDCQGMCELRVMFYNKLYTTFGSVVSNYLLSMSTSNLVNLYLGLRNPFLASLLEAKYEDFMSIAFHYIYLLWQRLHL